MRKAMNNSQRLKECYKWLKQCQTNIQSTAMLSGENHHQFNIKSNQSTPAYLL